LELKHPDYYHSLGFDMEDMLLNQLANAGYIINDRNDNHHDHHHKSLSSSTDLYDVQPIIIQCFDENSLRYLHTKTTFPLIQLLEHQSILFWTERDEKKISSSLTLQEIATYAQAIGPTKEDFGYISYHEAIKYIKNIKKYNLFIHPWTFRADREIILKFDDNFEVEQMYFYCCLGEELCKCINIIFICIKKKTLYF